MKKLCLILACLLCLCPVLCLSGCGEKTAISAEAFRTALEGMGYTIQDATADAPDPARTKVLYIATSADGAYQIEFRQYDTADTAEMIYLGNMLELEKTIGSNYSKSSASIFNYNSYRLTANGRFTVLLTIDETMIYADASEDYKEEIKEALEILGY